MATDITTEAQQAWQTVASTWERHGAEALSLLPRRTLLAARGWWLHHAGTDETHPAAEPMLKAIYTSGNSMPKFALELNRTRKLSVNNSHRADPKLYESICADGTSFFLVDFGPPTARRFFSWISDRQ